MDPQNLERIARNIGKIIDLGGPDEDIEAYLREEGFDSREAWVEAYSKRVVPNEPEDQPPHLQVGGRAIYLPPMAGDALDKLVMFGNQAGLGIPAMLSKDTREYIEDYKGRASQGAVQTLAALGGAATGLAASPLFAARTAATGLYPVGMGEFALSTARPSVASAAARTVGQSARSLAGTLMRQRWLRATGLLGAGAAAGELVRRTVRDAF